MSNTKSCTTAAATATTTCTTDNTATVVDERISTSYGPNNDAITDNEPKKDQSKNNT